jgi:hypothetical protein
MVEMFTDSQIEQLNTDPPRSAIKSRTQGGQTLLYVEGWYVIDTANKIFGHFWSKETVEMRLASERERKVGRNQDSGWGVTYTCKVRITVHTADGQEIVREGFGTGHGIDRDLGLAHESAVKEAETDALKRGMVTLGQAFGLSLYDKDSELRGGGHTNGNGNTPPKPGCISDPQVKRFSTIATNNKWSSEAQKKLVLDVCGVTTRKEIKISDYEKVCDALTDTEYKTRYGVA